MTSEEVADWMLAEVMREGTVYQESMASDMEGKFGKEFVPINDNGNLSIRRDLLAAFRKKSRNSVVWIQSEKAWRKREPFDAPGRKQE